MMTSAVEPGGPSRQADRIIAGVDGSTASIEALRWALDESAITGATVEAVYVYSIPGEGAWLLDERHPTLSPTREALVRSAIRELDRAVSRALGDPRPIALTTRVVPHVSPAAALSALSDHAALLVIGADHGGSLARLIGTTTTEVLARASCPVVVVGDDSLTVHATTRPTHPSP